MVKKKVVSVRPMQVKHIDEVLRLTYEAFPFEKAQDLEKLGSRKGIVEMMEASIRAFQIAKSRHLVAVDKQDKVLGFAAVRLLDNEQGRVSSSVLTLPRIVVDKYNRGGGVGAVLLKKVRDFAAREGYGAVMASVPEHLADWYTKAGWTVSLPGHIYCLLEQPHAGDDKFLPLAPPKGSGLEGKFSPIQTQEPGPPEHGYTLIASIDSGGKSDFITSWTSPADADDFLRGLWDRVVDNPSLLDVMPVMNSLILGSAADSWPDVPEKESKAFVAALEMKMKEKESTFGDAG